MRAILGGLMLGCLLSTPAYADDWELGYVFNGVAAGNYDIFDNDGNFIETINDGFFGFTTGGAFNADFSKCYTTAFGSSVVVVFDGNDPHNIIQTIDTTPFGGGLPESIVFDANGCFYVGHAGGNRDVMKFDSDGNFIQQFDVATSSVGTDWIDLSSDQQTLFYTSEGREIFRYDLVNDTQLSNFTTIGSSGQAFALRLLGPSFDGSDGLIVADLNDIKRLDSSGAVVQTYDVGGEDGWFAMNLDPNGTSFWGASFGTDNFYRFNIQTGALELGPINTGPGNTHFGLFVRGEITGGNTCPTFDPPTPCDQVISTVSGSPVAFDIVASDMNAGDVVTLDVIQAPGGATFSPPLPITGAPDMPVMSSFSWTPTNGDVGIHVVELLATDRAGCKTTCTITIEVDAECFLLLGWQPADHEISPGDKLLVVPALSFPVTLTSIPTFPIPNDPRLDGFRLYSQIYMNNPFAFPGDPIKMSNALEITLGGGTPAPYGQNSGMSHWAEQETPLGGEIDINFSIDQ